MENQMAHHLRPLVPGLILALLSIFLGFGLGGVFGAAEDAIKDRLNGSADAVLTSVYNDDSDRKDAVVKKAWAYMKRSHLHGGAIGTAALASIILLSLLGRPGLLERLVSAAFGAGALIYSIFWLLAAFKAPGLGSTSAAKEALSFVAIPGTALCLVGLLGTIVAVVKRLIINPPNA